MKVIVLSTILAVGALGFLAFVLTSCAKAPAGKAQDAEGAPRDASQILAVGEKAPPFDVVDDTGARVTLAQYAGKKNVVLIFYPGDETPGCTKQLCSARDDFKMYEAKDAVVFGVNPAGVESHAKFRANHGFPFPLLADTDGALVRDYGCRGMGGFTARTVYVIGKDGKVLFAERGMPETAKIVASIP